MVRVGLTADVLPLVSVARTAILWLPSVRAELVIMVYVPLTGQVCWLMRLLSMNKLTTSPEVQVPLKVGLATFETLSLDEVPLSELAARSGAERVAGMVVAILTVRLELLADTFPAASVAVTVKSILPAVTAGDAVKV